MNNLEVSKTNMFHRLDSYLGDNVAVYSGFTPFNDEVTLFRANVIGLDNLIAQESAGTGGITLAKEAAKQSMASYWAVLAKGGKAYAMKQKDVQLEASLNYTRAKIFNSTDSESAGICNTINTILSEPTLLGALAPYNIDAAKLTAGVALINTFHSYIGKQQSAEGVLTVVGREIDAKIDVLELSIGVMENLLDLIQPPNPTFSAGFIENSEIEDVGIRHTILKGTLFKAADGLPIINGMVKITDISRQANTDNLGQYAIEQFRSGTYIVEFSAPGFVTQTQTITFKRGKTLVKDVSLVAV